MDSLFSQRLDRAVFGTYFLGSVVPTAMLGAVAHRYALPSLSEDGAGTMAMIGLILGVGLLSLASFFALRRLVWGAAQQMDSDNSRLTAILRASRDFSDAIHTQAVADTASSCALELSQAAGSYVLLQASRGKPLLVCESSGEDPVPLYQANQERIDELLDAALAGDAPVVLKTDDPGAPREAPSAIAVVPFTSADGMRGAFVLLHTDPGAHFSSREIDAVASLAGFASVAFKSADLQNAQRNFFSHVTEFLVAALDAQLDRGDARAGHPNRIAALAHSIGRELGLEDDRLQRLHFGALLHDIGYLKIDRSLHVDPVQCRNHPVIGHRMLSRIQLWQDVAPIVLYHHEWYDGSGYPESRRGSEIPLESRIVAVADAFDKWTHEDFSQPAVSLDGALARLSEGAGGQFDPRVVEALTSVAGRGELAA